MSNAHPPRLELFSDAVLAIVLTIMVLELKPPHTAEWRDVAPLVPVFFAYVLSFLYIAIYWNNHHHLLRTVKRLTPGIMWANMHLLFWLSLIPFTTAWLGESGGERLAATVYGVVLFMAAAAYFILQWRIIRSAGSASPIAQAIGRDWKGKVSTGLYLIGIAASFFSTALAAFFYALVALLWIIPDRRLQHIGVADLQV